MTRILVTGGAGFIGSHLVDGLLRQSHAVRVLDDFSTGKHENLAHCRGDIELIEGDIRDVAVVEGAVRGVTAIFHEAAIASVPLSFEDPALANEVNVGGTVNLLQSARRHSVALLALASSCAVYGDQETLPIGEDAPLRPGSPYAASKAAGEAYCAAFAGSGGPRTVCFRYFNVFGPRQDPSSAYSGVIARFMDCALSGTAYPLEGDGAQTRDFIYVADIVEANVLALSDEADYGAGPQTQVLNLGTGAETNLLQIIHALDGLTGRSGAVRHLPPRDGDIARSLADVERARCALGFEARASFAEGLAATVAWARRAAVPPATSSP